MLSMFFYSSFQNGQITRERILVLFFFCSDVAILAIRNGLTGLVSNITRWSLDFIRNQVNILYIFKYFLCSPGQITRQMKWNQYIWRIFFGYFQFSESILLWKIFKKKSFFVKLIYLISRVFWACCALANILVTILRASSCKSE